MRSSLRLRERLKSLCDAPVLRSDLDPKTKEFNPRAFNVYGPKLIATRGAFSDPALESRCVTERMGDRKPRPEIPVNLPESFSGEAQALRNQLLLWRLRRFHDARDLADAVDPALEARVNQILAPLLSIVEDDADRETLLALAARQSRDLSDERSSRLEVRLLEVLRDLGETGSDLTVKAIAVRFAERFADEFERVTPRWIGWLLRERLGLRTRKTGGVFVVPQEEGERLASLFERFGLSVPGTSGTSGTSPGDSGDPVQGG